MALEDGSIVYPRSILESGRLYAGRPAKVVRELDAVELDAMHQSLRKHNSARAFAAVPTPEPETIGVHFIAATATLRGTVAIGDNVGVWFGCDLDGGTFGICVGDRTNIQDNTIIRSNHHPVGIAEEVTIGHNVTMNDCTVLARSLVGMGAVVSPGTIISEDVFLAAGAVTEPGQTLESGWLYGGNPARQLRRLDDEKRKIITSTWRVYMDYARDFDHEQRLIG
jgi:gamma-carbonic anhydrase